MNKLYWLIGLSAIRAFTGCGLDIVSTDRLKATTRTEEKS